MRPQDSIFYQPNLFGSVALLDKFAKDGKDSTFDEPIDELASQSKKVLLSISAIFPFDFFPDKIIVDETKINIIKRQFFFTEEVTSILLDNITDVEVFTSPFFASIKIRDASYVRFPRIFEVGFLTHKDAFELAKLLQGLIAVKRAQIDYSKVDLRTLVKDLETLGDNKETELS